MNTEKQHSAKTLIPVGSMVLDETVIVAPGTLRAYRVFIDLAKMSDCRITGSFSALGGSHNDVEFLVFDEKNYVEWEYRMGGYLSSVAGEVPALYRSGRVSTGTFDISVTRTDICYLVFNNSFSAFRSKTVKVKIYLNYRG